MAIASHGKLGSKGRQEMQKKNRAEHDGGELELMDGVRTGGGEMHER
jgi:hypothetical protein